MERENLHPKASQVEYTNCKILTVKALSKFKDVSTC